MATSGIPWGWLLVAALIVLLAGMRHRVLGRVVALVATAAGRKELESVQIEKMTLKPLQFFHVCIVQRDGIMVNVSRIQMDVHVKEFFASFGQTKLLWLIVDDVVVEIKPSKTRKEQQNAMNAQGSCHVQEVYQRGLDIKPKLVALGVLKYTQISIRSMGVRGILTVDQDNIALLGIVRELKFGVIDISNATQSIAVGISHKEMRVAANVLGSSAVVAEVAVAEKQSFTLHIPDMKYLGTMNYLKMQPTNINIDGEGTTVDIGVQLSFIKFLQILDSKTNSKPNSKTLKTPLTLLVKATKLQIRCKDDSEHTINAFTSVNTIKANIIGHQTDFDYDMSEASLHFARQADLFPLLKFTTIKGSLKQVKAPEKKTTQVDVFIDSGIIHWSSKLRQFFKVFEPTNKNGFDGVPHILSANVRCNSGAFMCGLDNDSSFNARLENTRLSVAKTTGSTRIEMTTDGSLTMQTPSVITLSATNSNFLLLETLDSSKTTQIDLVVDRVDVTIESQSVLTLHNLRHSSIEMPDSLKIDTFLDTAAVQWSFPQHLDSLIICSRAIAVIEETQALVAEAKSNHTKKAKKLNAGIAWNVVEIALEDIPHVSSCHIAIDNAKLTIDDGALARNTGFQCSRALLKHASVDILTVHHTVFTETKSFEMTTPIDLSVNAKAIAVEFVDNFKYMILVQQLQDLVNTKLKPSLRPPPPMNTTFKIDEFCIGLNPNDALSRQLEARCLLRSQFIYTKLLLTNEFGASEKPEAETRLRNLDTIFSYDSYSESITRLVSLEMEISLKSSKLTLETNEELLMQVLVESLTISGWLHEVTADYSKCIGNNGCPQKRHCASLHVNGDHLDAITLAPRRARALLPLACAALENAMSVAELNTSLDSKINPRLRFFGDIGITLTDCVYAHNISSSSTIKLKIGQVQLVLDKTYRTDCHITSLTMNAAKDMIAISRTAFVVQFIHQSSSEATDHWYITIAASVRSSVDQCNNMFALEWAIVNDLITSYLQQSDSSIQYSQAVKTTAPSTFNKIDKISFQLTVAPLQVAWWESPTASHAFLFDANTIDVNLVLLSSSSGWEVLTCKVASREVRGFYLENKADYEDVKMLPFALKNPTDFFIEATGIEYSKSSQEYVPIHVDEFKMIWTIKLRDHIFQAIDTIHANVAELTHSEQQTPNAAVSEPSEEIPAEVPSSLFDLLQQGKLGIASSSQPAPSTTTDKDSPPGLSLIKNYRLDIENAQINVLEPDSKNSMVVASRHIQVEWGHDALITHSMGDIQLKEMTCLVAPLDVDIAAGVMWYHGRTASTLLKPILTECDITCKYSMALHNKATFVELGLPIINLTVDSNQFFQCLNVVRHVLLAPPKTQKKSPPCAALGDIKAKRIQQVIADELRSRDLRSSGVGVALKCVAFDIGLARCRLRTSPEDGNIEFVMLELHEARGSHVYYENTSTKFNLTLRWLDVQNLKPGASSMTFDDPMAVLKPRLLPTEQASSMLAVRAETRPLHHKELPSIRIYDVFEISIFPGVTYDISIQLAVDFYDLMFTFFFGVVSRAEDKSGLDGNKMHLIIPNLRKKQENIRSPTSVPDVISLDEDDDDADSIVIEGNEELFYFNYVRIGNICLHIACHGFVVNLNGFGLELPPFVCRGKLCTWKKLLRKFEMHLAWHVSKESASSGLNHVKKKLFTLNKTLHLKWKDKKGKEATEDDNMNALFGPYHIQPDADT